MAAWTQRVHDGQHSPDPGEVAALLSDAPRARALFEPLRVVLAGVPNAGKSTLFNTLLGQRRVVTHSAPGTTRDVVEEEILVGAYPVVLRDGAGVRPAADPIEREGVDRMATAIAKSDLVVLLEPVAGPGSDPAAAHALAEAVADAQRAGRLLRVQSRVDEDPGPTSRGGLAVSGKTGAGVADLVAAMGERLFGGLEPPRGRPVPFTADLERWLQELAQKS